MTIGGLHPDHASIARFRAKHEQALGGLFSQVLRRLAAEGMVSLGTSAWTAPNWLATPRRRRTRRCSEENFARADQDKLRLLALLAKDPGRPGRRPPKRARHLDQYPAIARATRRMRHPRGREDYKLRARTVEPVFGQLKTCQKLSAMSQRGLTACESEWLLACTAHNLRKLHRYRLQG